MKPENTSHQYPHSTNYRYQLLFLVILLTSALCLPIASYGKDELSYISPRPLKEPLSTPKWFKLSFLDLKDDLNDAREAGKKGLIVIFAQKYCPYCKAHYKNNWTRGKNYETTRKYFEVISIDVQGDRPVTGLDGKITSEKEYATKLNALFTPTFFFYDLEGKITLRFTGYYPPAKFSSALQYVISNQYKNQDFRAYLSRQ
ncbi:MAG: hypothetical protein BMS9Abin36_0388 [Gammaproteobacteria bacterium]|nr:MAG: hypothetical protein BMS9Abin36_0388 [Gammaproteobacteria bacterium]